MILKCRNILRLFRENWVICSRALLIEIVFFFFSGESESEARKAKTFGRSDFIKGKRRFNLFLFHQFGDF